MKKILAYSLIVLLVSSSSLQACCNQNVVLQQNAAVVTQNTVTQNTVVVQKNLAVAQRVSLLAQHRANKQARRAARQANKAGGVVVQSAAVVGAVNTCIPTQAALPTQADVIVEQGDCSQMEVGPTRTLARTMVKKRVRYEEQAIPEDYDVAIDASDSDFSFSYEEKQVVIEEDSQVAYAEEEEMVAPVCVVPASVSTLTVFTARAAPTITSGIFTTGFRSKTKIVTRTVVH